MIFVLKMMIVWMVCVEHCLVQLFNFVFGIVLKVVWLDLFVLCFWMDFVGWEWLVDCFVWWMIN